MAVKKCVVCGEVILPTDKIVPYKKRYAHEKCFDIAMKAISQNKAQTLAKTATTTKQIKSKPKAVLKDGMSEEEYAKKKRYYNYLESLMGEEITTKQVALTEHYINRYKFTFEGMYKTLVYLREILNKELINDIVGLIPYYYTESQQFEEELQLINKENQAKSYPDIRTIRVSPPKRKRPEIDITQIKESS